MDFTRTEVKFDPPIGTLSELKGAIDRFIEQNPNPSPDSEPRSVKLFLTIGGKLKGMEVTSANHS